MMQPPVKTAATPRSILVEVRSQSLCLRVIKSFFLFFFLFSNCFFIESISNINHDHQASIIEMPHLGVSLWMFLI